MPVTFRSVVRRRSPLNATIAIAEFTSIISLAAVIASGAAVEASAPDDVPEVEFRTLPNGPDRGLHTMVYDSFNDMLWSFGGVQIDVMSNSFFNTLYRLDLSDSAAVWTLMPISGLKPPPVALHSAVFDPVRQQMIVFGGIAGRSGSSSTGADTASVWLLDLRDPLNPVWTRETVVGNAVDRFAHAAVYVDAFDAMVVSAGAQTFDRFRGDNYALMLGESPKRWVRLANAGFTPRAGHALIFDALGERLLVYGGVDEDADANRELVALDLSEGIDGADSWRRVTPSTPGLERGFSATAFDPVRRLWWFHGGRDRTNFLNDLSVLDLSSGSPEWVRTSLVSGGPNRRFHHVAAWDPLRDRVIFQGGTPDNDRTLRDTRALLMLDDAPTATASATATTGIATPTATSSTTPTASPTTEGTTATPSATADATVDATTSPTASVTPTASATDSETQTPTATATASATATKVERAEIYLPIVMRAFEIARPPTATPPPTDTSSVPTLTPPVGATPTPTPPDDATPTPTPPVEATPTPTSTPTPTEIEPTATPPATPTATLEPISIDVIGQYGGESFAVAAGDGIAAVNIGPRVHIFDPSDPAAPVELHRTDVLPFSIRGLTFDGEVLYVVHDGGLEVLDVSDPSAPAAIGSLALFGAPRHLEISGTLGFLASSPGMDVLDLSDPAAPEVLASLRIGGLAYQVEVVDDLAYVAAASGLAIVDISDPAAPVIVGEHATASAALGVAVGDGFALLANSNDGLFVIDVSDPAAPSELAVLDTEGRPRGVEIVGDRAFVANDFGGLAIVDVSDPAAPALETAFATGARLSFAVALFDGIALLASVTDGLRVVDVTDAAAPVLGGAIDLPGRGVSIGLAGDHALVGFNFEGVLPFDVADPSSPVPATFMDEFRSPDGLAIVGNRMYVGDNSTGLTIHDISDPAAPVELGAFTGIFGIQDIAIEGDIAYVADLFSGLHIIDVGDETAPARLGELAIEGQPVAIAIADGVAYVANLAGPAVAIDVSDPTAPSLLTTLETSENTGAVLVDGDRLYVGDGVGELHVFDISTPATPTLLGMADLRQAPEDLAIAGSIVYSANFSGMALIDVSDPAAPIELIHEFLYGRQFGIAVSADGGLAYLVGDSGLLIVGVTIR